ncbi:hypothetical protein BU14_0171s0027 [Porphyra umbilicalis]|uniref:RING-type domain-containing protein n=1 Tax=Porphyra umbilicalis TaxID=2786 RepID=A0A1X6P7L2_PORUM|nr:hypothetical protein BU14_0171s0027 [Porphyra umbilicalis]|eukprot:OSX76879.1 hypothetical protein BU14_0171s0027 [Porphyra umbilicalis]
MPPATSVDAAAAATGGAEDEVPQCPLCLEDLDATDLSVRACQCGYPVCLLCLHHIREQLNGKCPACRTPYSEKNFVIDKVDPEAAAREVRERAEAKKAREKRDRAAAAERDRAAAAAASQAKAKTTLKHVRVVQRNLVYVIGLSLSLAREEALKRAQMFGRFGRISRVLVNRGHPYNADAPGGPSIAAYILFARDTDASTAARVMNGEVFDGRELRCAIATTKYCDAFIPHGSGKHLCGNEDCPYLHELAPYPEDVLTREEVLARQLGPPPPAHLFTCAPTLPTPAASSSLRLTTALASRRAPAASSSLHLPSASPPLTASRPPAASPPTVPTAPTSFAGVAGSAPSPAISSSHDSWLLKLPPPRATGGGWGAAADATDPSTPAQLRSRTPSPADVVTSALLTGSSSTSAAPSVSTSAPAPAVSVSLPPLTSTRRSRASPKAAAAAPPAARVTLPPPPGFQDVAAAPTVAKSSTNAAAAPPPPGFGNFPSLSQARAVSTVSSKPVPARSLSTSSTSSNSGSRENLANNFSTTTVPPAAAPAVSAPPGFVAPSQNAKIRLPPPSSNSMGAPGFSAPSLPPASASPPASFHASPAVAAKAESPRPTFAAPRTSPSVLAASRSSTWSVAQEPARHVADGLARTGSATNMAASASTGSSPSFTPAPVQFADASLPSANALPRSEPASSPPLGGVLFADASTSGPPYASNPDLAALLAQLGGGPSGARGTGSGVGPSGTSGPTPAGFSAAFPSAFGSGMLPPLPSPPQSYGDPRSGHGLSPRDQPNAGPPPGINRGAANPPSVFGSSDTGRAYAPPPAPSAFASSLPPLPPPSEGSFATGGGRPAPSARSRSRFGFARGGRTSPGPSAQAASSASSFGGGGLSDGSDGFGSFGGGGGFMNGGGPVGGDRFTNLFSSLELEPPTARPSGLDYPPGISRPPGFTAAHSSPPSSSYASPSYGGGGVLGQSHLGAPYGAPMYPSQAYSSSAYASPYGGSSSHSGGAPPGMAAAAPTHSTLSQHPRTLAGGRPTTSSSPARSSRFAFAGAGSAGGPGAAGPPPGMGHSSPSMYFPPGSDGSGMGGGMGGGGGGLLPRGGFGDAGATAAPPGFGPPHPSGAAAPPPAQADTNFTEMSTQDKLAAIFSSARNPRQQSSTPALRIN